MVIAYRWNPTGFHPIKADNGGRREAPVLRIDYPRPDERIALTGYAFRIDAPGGARVEVSIDGGDWRPCRAASGYWWFDWDGYQTGGHHIRARAAFGEAQFHVSTLRRFQAGVWPQ